MKDIRDKSPNTCHVKRLWRCIVNLFWKIFGHFIPNYDLVEFDEFYKKLVNVKDGRIEIVKNLFKEQYDNEITRRNGIDNKARSMFASLSIAITLLFVGSGNLGCLIETNGIYYCMLIVASALLMVSIVLAALVFVSRNYRMPEEKNYLNDAILNHDSDSLYAIYLAWGYYESWIYNLSRDEQRARLLKIAQIVFVLALVLIAILGYGVIANSPTLGKGCTQ